MTEFISRKFGQEEFEVIIKTDSKENFKAAEGFARKLIDHAKPTNADRIRAMSDEELAEFLCNVYDADEEWAKFIDGHYILYDQYSIKEWLKQPAEEGEDEL